MSRLKEQRNDTNWSSCQDRVVAADKRPRYWVLRFKTVELEIGPKVWVAVGLAVVLIFLGVIVSGWAGAAVGVSGVIGAGLGALLQTQPIPEDLQPKAFAAVNELNSVAQSLRDAYAVLGQLADLNPNQRVLLGMANVQEDLQSAQIEIYKGIVQWEGVAPGVIEDVEKHQSAGRDALRRLAGEGT